MFINKENFLVFMKLIHKDIRKGIVKAKIESLDDLWYLSHIISEGDLISGKTFRKIKIGDNDNAKVVKKPFWLKINVEKVEFAKYSDVLRVSGKVTEGNEDISNGSYHTFNLEENTEFTVEKEEFLSYQIEKLEEAASEKTSPILLLVLDREDAYFALMKKYGYENLTHLSGNVQKKDFEQQSSNFYKEISKVLFDYDSRSNFESIIVASPAFFKEDFMKEVDDDLKKKIVLATVSSVNKNAFTELLKREEVTSALKKDKASKEMKDVEKVMSEISKDGKAVYGIKETADAANAGAVETLLVSDALIFKMRTEEKYKEIDLIMQLVDKSKGKVHIISSEHDGGKQLDGLGGIAGLLRYKLN